MSLAQAQRQLRPTQLDLRSGPRTYSETVPEGDIVSTEWVGTPPPEGVEPFEVTDGVRTTGEPGLQSDYELA